MIGQAEAYIEQCRVLACKADPSVVISLQTGWEYVKCSSAFSLAPLLQTLEKDDRAAAKLERIRIKRTTHGANIADANARVLGILMGKCKNLKHVDVSNLGLSMFGGLEIVKGVKKTSSLETLNISFNPGVHEALADGHFEAALRTNSTLVSLDLTNNLLGFAQVEALRKAMKQSHKKSGREFEIIAFGNNVFEEVLNAVTHGIGIIFAIAATWVLLTHASAPGQTRRTYWACAIYGWSLITLFTCSTLLHSAFLSRTLTSVLVILDHCAIYFLIAGSYMPFCLISLHGHPYANMVAIAEWVLAAFGVLLCFVNKRFPIPFMMPIELVLYLSMGWMLTVAWDEISVILSEDAMHLLMCGGLCYSGGVTFFILEKTHHPIGHTIWHIFVLAGAICHYFAVLLYVVGLEDEAQTLACTST
mmetsp:Transcript_19781/g.32503  ORF Transcript_19781/g.32503 Transcript_19781/m.32503 type:complete len:418 (-) Transcript_19781:509-1762(-)|eukprot:CAMPEP_0203774610 /NCGR_PEP_ID=MMETSP0099_2-20121227/5466_1 /ASSEMBLY_ACC=CAM_ASM_000209 /TAXON_ID=96639 /ORGANISM=" , Strain NY0313808BC1" /LENGTH=417 /DNA_ID=CAMNT_0050672885 /DNA_START=136 /DNA_END=1389 /DNA_ORIENTATION=+